MIRVQKYDLVKALSIIKPAIQARTTLPVLSHVALVSYDGQLVVMGTDLETFVETRILCDGEEEEVSICVPYAIFSRYVGALEDDVVYLGSNATTLAVEQGKSSAEFPGISYEEFPLVPQVDDKNTICLDTSTLGYAFGSVLHAAAVDESRPVLTGVFVKYDGDTLTTVCADGFRLVVTNTPYTGASPFQMIVPAKSIAAVLKCLPKDNGEAFIKWDDTRLIVELPYDGNVQTQAYCQTIQGNYVNYNQIIPRQSSCFGVTSELLVSSVKRCAVFSSAEANVIHFTLSGSTLTLDGRATDTGEGIEQVPISYEGANITFALNASYVLEALATCGEFVNIEVTAPSRPIVISSERNKHLCILMPMHVRPK